MSLVRELKQTKIANDLKLLFLTNVYCLDQLDLMILILLILAICLHLINSLKLVKLLKAQLHQITN